MLVSLCAETIKPVSEGEIIFVDGGIRTHDPEKPWSVGDVVCQGISGVIFRLTTDSFCKMLTNNLPKLSLLTPSNNARMSGDG